KKRLVGIYTFGQPMVGDEAFAQGCSHDTLLRDRTYRHVFRKDVVPHLPPGAVGFEHFGREYHVARSGHGWEQTDQIRQPASWMGGVVWPTFGFTQRLLGHQWPGYTWYDHMPNHYIDASRPA